MAGRYRLGRLLGRGGEGETFEALDESNGATRALKVFRSDTAGAFARVRFEYERLRSVEHPHIVQALDVGRDGARPFLVTTLVMGAAVSTVAELSDDDRRREVFERSAWALTDALGYLHGRGIVHGDIAPENVRLGNDGILTLIDLGVAAVAGLGSGGAVGTLGFAPPEALVGRVHAGSDLYGLGATLFAAWAGTGPFGVGAPAVARMLAGPAPRLSVVRAGLGEGWDELIAELLASSPERRPSSARSVLRRLARLVPGNGVFDGDAMVLPPFPAGDPLAGLFVGRQHERAVLQGAFEQLSEGACAHAVVACTGVAGSGRRSLLSQALQELAIAQMAEAAAPIAVFRGSLAELQQWAVRSPSGDRAGAPVLPEGRDQDPIRGRDRWFGGLLAEIERRAAEAPVLAALTPGTDEAAFAAFVAGAPPTGRSLLILPVEQPLQRPFALDLPVDPLAEEALAALAGRAAGEEVPAGVVGRIARASGGHAATAAMLIRQFVDAVRRGQGDRFAPAEDAALADLLDSSFAELAGPVRRIITAVALGLEGEAEGNASGESPREILGPLAAASEAGWLPSSGAAVERHALASAAHVAAVRRALRRQDLLDLVARALDTLPEDDGWRGVCLEALGRPGDAAEAFLVAAQRSPPREAVEWLAEAFRLAPHRLDPDQRIALGTAQALAGDLVAADLTLAGDGAAPLAPPARLRLAERRAWVKGRQGEWGAAATLLERALVAPDAGGATADEALARARLARVLVSLGRFDDAIAAARAVLELGGGDTAATARPAQAFAVAVEALALSYAYTGQNAAARALLQGGGDAARALPSARAAYLTAFNEHLSGRLREALAVYRQALPAAEADGDVHTVAAIALNLGALAAEAGAYGESLAVQDRAIRELGRIGAGAELVTALFNAAMLFIALGDGPAVRAVLARLRTEGTRHPIATARAWYIEAELALRAGDDAAAGRAFTALGDDGAIEPALRPAVGMSRVELLGRSGRLEEAGRLLDALTARADAGQAAPDLRLARGRLRLMEAALNQDEALSLAGSIQSDAAEAAARGRRAWAWRGHLVAARLFHRAGRTPEAARALGLARTLFEEIRMATPKDHQTGLERDSDARLLADVARLETGGGEGGSNVRGGRADDRLRRLLRINKRLNSELRLPRLLELIMDTVIELTEAERGFLLLEDDKGELAVKVARNFDQQTLETGAFELSRSIARQAVAGGAPILTIDAAGDPRFREALSVSDLHLRSVLAVPLSVKGRAVGTVYVDNRLRRGAFGDDDVQLVLDLAEQAGIAIENARLLSELRRRERQIEVLNRRLESELAVRKEELSGIKQELRESREALAIRYDYRNIVGRTPRMLELFRLLDRLTDTLLPVVIQGESGTGKELVARALHFNGLRKDRPFVSENCAAIPETLLESTLFGTVRGAYTGADHDTRGLFEVADGGTLFLDEVGEMSAGMQGKLLRVLQTGELRRVGSERTRKVDVRIIAATNRDLGRMVEEGRFRQDLFFRLAVATIALPPLRDRRDDIPAIVEHVLTRLGSSSRPASGGAAAAAKRVDPAAMARLVAYRWPGNVRELENELLRAAALSGERIQVADLSPQVAGQAEAALTGLDDPDSLTLRPRVERLERALLREALARSGNNQTRAAEALGLSRFGLQKKLRRYQMG